MPTILLMRHAKADRPPGLADRDRPLTDRGNADAAAIGRALARIDPAPGSVITSPARRAHQTAAALVAAAGWQTRPIIDPDLYGGGVEEVLAAIRSVGDDVAVLVGHEPTWSAAVHAITGASVQMVTGAVAAIDVPPGARRPGSLMWMLIPRLVGGGPE